MPSPVNNTGWPFTLSQVSSREHHRIQRSFWHDHSPCRPDLIIRFGHADRRRDHREHRPLHSAPGHIERCPFETSPCLIVQRDGATYFDYHDNGDSSDEDDSDQHSREDSDDGDNGRADARRQHRAYVAAFALLNGTVQTGPQSPVAGSDSGYDCKFRQVRTAQHMPREEPSRRVSTVSSTSWKHHGVVISGSRIVRARRALSAPLQGVLDDVFAKDKLGQTNVAANHTQKLIQDNTAFISQRNSEPESFPPYHDVYAQVSNAVSSLTSAKTATSLSPRNQPKVQYEDQNEKPRRPSQHRLHDELPGSATPSQGDSLSPSMKRRLTETMACLVRLHSHIGSHHTGSSSPSAVSIAYHRIGSSLGAAMDGPSPSTTYSPAHENDAAPDLIATPVQTEDRGVNDITSVPIATPLPLTDVDISPWVQNLHENETVQNLSNTRPRRRSRLARFFQKIVRRASSRPKSLNLKRLWRRVRVWRSKSSCRHTPPIREEGVRPTKLARKGKPAKPSRHTQAAKTTSTGQARKQATQTKPPRTVQGHDHRTAKGVTHDILSSRAEAKAKRAFEAAPLLGAANTVFMAGS